MTDEAKRPLLRAVIETEPKTASPADASDFDSLWLDPKIGDGITDTHYHSVPVGRPKDFFRLHPNKDYRRRTEIYTHKPEGVIDEQHFIIAAPLRGRIEEAQPCTLVCVIYRDGSPRLWPLKLPKEGERDNEAWISARSGARESLHKWVKLLWKRRAYITREAPPGYAPDPDWLKLPTFDELVRLGLGVHGIMRDTDHPIYRELFGEGPRQAGGKDDDDVDL
jgi:hypothetical protein